MAYDVSSALLSWLPILTYKTSLALFQIQILIEYAYLLHTECIYSNQTTIRTLHRLSHYYISRVRVMVLNATFSNISVVSWRSVLLVEETKVHEESHRPAASHSQTISHNVVSSARRLNEIRNHIVGGDRC